LEISCFKSWVSKSCCLHYHDRLWLHRHGRLSEALVWQSNFTWLSYEKILVRVVVMEV
jgi:hypothetical protein